MKHFNLDNDTAFLNYIIMRLQKEKLVENKSEKELFAFLIPNKSWQKYKKSWYHWRNEYVKSLRKSKDIKEAIAKTLQFDSSVWNASSFEKMKALQNSIKFLKKSKNVDISSILPKDSPMTKEQEELLKKIKNIFSCQEIKKHLLQYPHFLEQRISNQSYILELLNYLYRLACYDLLEEYIFKALLPDNRCSNTVRIIEAHTLGSLSTPRFEESARLLNSITPTNNLQEIDIKTAAISNIKRYYFSEANITKENLQTPLATLIRHYYELYVFENEYHYYPAINLLYLLKIVEFIFGKESQLLFMNPFEIEKTTLNSLKKDMKSTKKANRYYAYITKLEIQMLLYPHKEIKREFGLAIESLQPSQDMLQRTQRQIQQFITLVEKFNPYAPLDEIKKVQKLLLDASKSFKTPHKS